MCERASGMNNATQVGNRGQPHRGPGRGSRFRGRLRASSAALLACLIPVRFLSDAELARLSSWPDEIDDDQDVLGQSAHVPPGTATSQGRCRRRSSAMMSFGVMSDDTSTPFSFAMRARLAEVNIGVPP